VAIYTGAKALSRWPINDESTLTAGSEAWTLVVVQTSAREAAFAMVANATAVEAREEYIVSSLANNERKKPSKDRTRRGEFLFEEIRHLYTLLAVLQEARNSDMDIAS
jgi:hypothetical protein